MGQNNQSNISYRLKSGDFRDHKIIKDIKTAVMQPHTSQIPKRTDYSIRTFNIVVFWYKDILEKNA